MAREMVDMAKLTRRAALTTLGTASGLLGIGYVLRNVIGELGLSPVSDGVARADGPGMMGGAEMSTYMNMFNRHNEISRTVEEIPGGVRTTTESDAPELAAQLHAHVPAMYARLDQGAEIMCMSASLPTLFGRATNYRRELTLTAKGVVAVETADDPELTHAIRAHAQEVTGFVTDGMPAMMRGMMGGGMMGMGS
jgi:hypothetical protein